jgi:hypothetical protein
MSRAQRRFKVQSIEIININKDEYDKKKVFGSRRYRSILLKIDYYTSIHHTNEAGKACAMLRGAYYIRERRFKATT